MLEEALAGMESAVKVPVESERLWTWCNDLVQAVERARPRVVSYSNSQRGTLDQVAEDDPGRVRRLEHLGQRLIDLRAGFTAIKLRSLRLLERAGERMGREETFESAINLREAVQDWVERARVHHEEVDIWFQESLYRGRGLA